MTLTFKNAPLVEMVAEVRWASEAGTPPGTLGPMLLSPASAKHEELFMRFGGAIYQHGFQRSERLVPPGFPAPLGQVTYRYHKNDGEALQIGPNVLSANGMPPYKSWNHFRPTVETGLKALIEARSEPEAERIYNYVTLRYINLFQGPLLMGHEENTFLNDVLGFKISAPKAFDGLGDQTTVTDSNVSLRLKITDNFEMTVAAGKARVGNQNGVLLDLGINATGASEGSEIMNIFDRQHEFIHDLFVGITKKFSDILQPEEI